MSKNKSKLNLSRLMYNNKFVLIFAIIIAVIFWMSIKIGQSVTIERTISDVTVNITTENTSVAALGLDVVSGGTNQRVNVKVSGPSYVISSLTSSDILVTASLSEVTAAGTYRVPLIATKNSSALTDYTIVSITPDTIEVAFDNIDTRTFTPTVQAEGAAATEGLVAEAAVITDTAFSTIDISGPRTEVSKISSVVAYAQVGKTLSATESFDAVIKLLDADGNEIDQSAFTLSYTKLKITVPISRSKQLPIVPTFENLPGAYTASSIPYALSATSVTVLGPPEVVDNLTQIELAPIDFDNVTAGQTEFTCALNLPNAVKDMDSIANVTVTLSLGDIKETTVNVATVNSVNLTDGLTANISQTIRNVKLCGPAEVIDSLNVADVYAEVDLTGRTAGEHTVPARIKVKNLNNVWQVGVYTTLVTIS